MAAEATKSRKGERQPVDDGTAAVGIQQEAAAIVELEALRARLEEVEADLAGASSELAEERDLDRCVSMREGAKKAGVSHDYLYKHRQDFPFVLQMGTRWVVDLRKLRECKDQGGMHFEKPTPPPMTLGTANRRRRRSSRAWH
jgi:hypothetical protein